MQKIKFVEYNEIFLEKSWEWLNDKEIKYLTCTPDFTKEQQKEWFLSLKGKKDYFIKGVLCNNTPIGVAGLKNITDTDGEYWGYIGEKEYWNKGIGKELINYISHYGYILNLKEIYLKVIKDNIRAIKLYQKMGFKKLLKENDLIYMKLDLNNFGEKNENN